MPITMLDIRARYPHPQTSAAPRRSGVYCVGSACLLAAGLPWTDVLFPGEDDVARALCQLNPALASGGALGYAIHIIQNNDHGRFAAAWEYVAFALEED